MRGAARLAFAGMLVAVLLLTLLPIPAAFERLGNDKIEHMLAFFALAVFGGLAWPQARSWIATALLVIGALIEMLQGTPFVHRDMSVLDWFADAGGILLGMTLVGLMLRLDPRSA